MMARFIRRVFSGQGLGVLFLLVIIVAPLAYGLRLILFAPVPEPSVSAVLTTVATVVEVQGTGGVGFKEAKEDQVLVPGDDVRTSNVGRGIITFEDESMLVLEPGSEITILPPVREGGGLLNRLKQSFGNSWGQLGGLAGGRFEIQTAAGVISVRDGAVLRVGVGRGPQGQAVVTIVVVEGSAQFTSTVAPDQPVTIAANQILVVEEGEPPPEPEPFVPENRVVTTLSSPFWLLVTEPRTGASTGLIPPGVVVNQIVLSSTTGPAVHPQTVSLLEPIAGTYTLFLLPRGDEGPFTVSASGAFGGLGVFEDAVSGVATKCQWLYLLLEVELDPSGNLFAGRLLGPFIATAVPLVSAQKIESGCPAPSPLTAQVLGAQATATSEAGGPPATAEPTTPAGAPTPPPVEATAAPTSEVAGVQATAEPTQEPTSPPAEPTAPPEIEFPPPIPPPPDIAIDKVEEGLVSIFWLVVGFFTLLPAFLLRLHALLRKRGERS
jgi:hypothetical protein